MRVAHGRGISELDYISWGQGKAKMEAGQRGAASPWYSRTLVL